MAPGTISERMIRLLPFLSKIFSQRSRVTAAFGWEQHTSTFPGAGRSNGSGSYVVDPPIRSVMQVWQTPDRHDHLTGTSHASASSSKLPNFGFQAAVIPLRANETGGPDPGGPWGR